MRKSVSESINKPRIGFTDLFNRQRKRAPEEIQMAFRDAQALFLEDQFHPQLRNHQLTGKLAGYRSINITGDWRALFKVVESGNRETITFHKLGTHKDLYGK